METKVLTAHIPLLAEQVEERRRLTREALADVDDGCVIDHEAVQACADRLDGVEPLAVPR